VKSVNSTLYFSRLDHLRFFAAVLVMLQHGLNDFGASEALKAGKSPDFFSVWVENGRIGVTLFLVLSGFLFTIITKAGSNEILYGTFIYNRFLRIFPLLIVVFFMLLTAGRGQMQGIDILNLIFLQLNIGNPDTGFGNEYLPVGPLWTIAVEFQFYLIFPFLIIFYRKYGVKYFVGLIFVMIGLRLMIWNIVPFAYTNLYHTIIGRLDQFLVGMILGVIYLQRNKIYFKNPIWLVSFLLIFTFLLKFNEVNMFKGVLGFTLEGIAWCVIILAYLDMKLKIPLLIEKSLTKLGELSFSLYLLHLLVFSSFKNQFGIIEFSESIKYNAVFNTILIGLPITILFSLLTYTFIEKPFMDFRKPYLVKKRNLMKRIG
jgi:peptidoglycan/LPS O-acetylase OafA/YrhL